MSQNRAIEFHCIPCNYVCSKKGNYNRHINTAKHNLEINGSKWKLKKEQHHICIQCNREYNTLSGLWKHKQKCNNRNENIHNLNVTKDDTQENSKIVQTMMHLIKQNQELIVSNQEFKELITEQNKTIIELSKKDTTTNNNNTTNITIN